MASIGFYHPIIVHFVIALLFVGVAFRLVSLTGKFQFTDLGALTLILVGTVAAVLAVKSGHEAHELVERIPGVRPAVGTHEEWGERARNAFLVVGALELLAFLFRRAAFHRALLVVSAVAGIGACVVLYVAGDKGGDLVYAYAGGPGLRSGDTTDVHRLFLAGLYNEAMLDRKDGRSAEAAQLIDEMAQRFPQDTTIRLLAIESLITDRKDPKAALAALKAIAPPPGDAGRFLRLRTGMLEAEAFRAAGMADSAQAVTDRLSQEFPMIRTRRPPR